MESRDKIQLLLKPVFNHSLECQSLWIQLTVSKFNVINKENIVKSMLEPNNEASSTYDPSKILVSDSQGLIPIFPVRDENGERFAAGRDVLGTCIIKYSITLSEFESIPGFHKQESGLILVGKWFLPRWTDNSTIQMEVKWDFRDIPDGNRAVCSFGEGPEPVSKTGTFETLLDCVFMFGAIKSDPLPSPGTAEVSGACGTYWLMDLPPNLASVTGYTSNIFPRISDFFRDANGSYRTFLMRVPHGLTGITYHASSIIDFDHTTENAHDYDLVRVLNYHMVASWVHLDAEADGAPNDWFTQGKSLNP